MIQRIALLTSLGVVGLLTQACDSSDTAEATAANEYVVIGSGGGDEEGLVSTYSLDRTTGDLTQIDRKRIGGTLVSFLAVNSTKPVMYVSDPRSGRVHWAMIDPATGIISTDPAWFQEASGGPEHLAVDASGSVLIGVNFGAGTADVFPLDPTDGAIQPLTSSVETGRNPHFAEFSPDNRFVYLASQADNYLSQFSFDGRSLTPLTPPRLDQLAPRQFRFHPAGNVAYSVSGPTDNVAVYSVSSDGTLTAVDSVRRMPSDYTGSLNSTGGTINITPDGRFAYVNNRGSNTISTYSIDAVGSLDLIGHESTRGSTPRHAGMDIAGEFLIVGNQDSQSVAVFRIDKETGALTHLHSEDIAASPYFIGVWPFP